MKTHKDPDLTIAPNSVFDLTQPGNATPNSGGGFTLASLGNLSTWLNTAIAGTGTVLGALNNKPATTATAAAAPAASQSIPAWVWIGGAAGMVLLALFLFLAPKK